MRIPSPPPTHPSGTANQTTTAAAASGQEAEPDSSAPSTTAPAPSEGAFGPEGPLWVEGAAFNATWVAWCEPERDPGSHTAPASVRSPAAERTREVTLAWADGKRQSITAVLGQSPDGRGLVIDTGERWELIDTLRHVTVDLDELGVDRRRALSDRIPRAIAFHPSLPVVALLTKGQERPLVIVLDYDTGRRGIIRPSSRQVFRLTWEPSGSFLFLQEIPEDTNGNQRVDWPEPELRTDAGRCAEPLPRFVVATGRVGDRVVWTTAPRTGGDASAADGFMLHAPEGWLTMGSDGRVELRATNGASRARQLTPPSCEPWSVGAHGPTHQLLVGCHEKGRLGLALVSPRGFRPLGIDMPPAEDLGRRNWSSRLLPVYAGTKSYLVDFERSALVELQDRDQLLAQQGDQVLLRRGSAIVRRDLGTREDSVLVSDIAAGARLIAGSDSAWIDPYFVPAAPRFEPVRIAQTVVALSRNGCALAYTQPFDPPQLPRGPLRWVCGTTPSAHESALSSARTEPKRVSGSTASPCSTQESTFGGNSGRN